MRLTDITGSPLNKNEFLLDDFYIHDFRGNEFVRSNESFTLSSSLTKKKKSSSFIVILFVRQLCHWNDVQEIAASFAAITQEL